MLYKSYLRKHWMITLIYSFFYFTAGVKMKY
nr:MAG TPA: hypothetical protein [Inoviridae sp.]